MTGRIPRIAVLSVAVLFLTMAVPASAQAAERPGIGMDQGSVSALGAAGAPPEYGSFWVGAWMASSGWGGLENAMRSSVQNGNTLVVYWYYWGDAITPACVEQGCSGRTKAQWVDMTATLAQKLRDGLGGREVIVVLENEFNKGGISDASYAPTFDAYLASRATELKAVPGVRVVLGFGGWGEDAWSRFPQAIAASDLIGFQVMRASTRDTAAGYEGAADRIASLLGKVDAISDKGAFLYDLALSSYPDASWADRQGATLATIFERGAALRAAGLEGIIYRELRDNPGMGPENYYGYAEQYWGLKSSTGAEKPAWRVWLAAHGAPAAPASPPQKNVPGAFEGESMPASTGGRQGDTGASGGAVWNLWTNGALSQRVVSDGGAHRVVVVARGTSAQGVDARMEVRLDGRVLGTFDVAAGALREHLVEAALPSGVAQLEVAFVNDAFVNGEDRNLLVDVVRVDAKPPNQPPTARFDAAARDLALAVDASASSDPEGAALSYRWDFGDGATATGASATHAYGAAGTYQVRLVVTDGEAESVATREVQATMPNRAPTASFVVDGRDLSWSFDASGSSDPDGDALTFTWALGDGTTATGPTVSHTYARAGDYVVSLRVSEGRGGENAATRAVTAREPNRAPAAAIVVTGGERTFTFDASGTTDADGDAPTFAWDLGDGTTLVGARVTHTFARDGDFTVRLRATDPHGAVGEASRVVAAKAPPPPPPASAYRAMQAELFAKKDNGQAFADPKASNGSAWLLWSNGAARQAFAPGAGTFRAEVVARGDFAGGWPTMELRAGGVLMARWSVSSASWTSYAVDVPFKAGETRTLTVHFTNDANGPDGDRNLRVDVVRLRVPGISLEAEAMRPTTGGVFADGSASGGKAWLLWANGALSSNVTPAGGGLWTVEVVARGDYAQGWPVMELRMDGSPVARWNVTSSAWQTYRTNVQFPTSGTATLSVHFLNDYKGVGGDRNLRVDVVRLTPTLP